MTTRPGQRLPDGDVLDVGPRDGTVWLLVGDPDIAGVVGTPESGYRNPLTTVEQRARLAKATAIHTAGIQVAIHEVPGETVYGVQLTDREYRVHLRGCQGLERASAMVTGCGDRVPQRAVAADAVLRGGPFTVWDHTGRHTCVWCPTCLGEAPNGPLLAR